MSTHADDVERNADGHDARAAATALRWPPIGRADSDTDALSNPNGRRQRRWPWIVFIVILLAAGGGVCFFALHEHEAADANHKSAQQWRHRAAYQRTQLTKAANRISAYHAQLLSTQKRLKAAKASVARLERRQRQLVNEKSHVEDQRAAFAREALGLGQQRDALVNIASGYIQCSTDMASMADAIANDYYDDSYYYTADASCGAADSALSDYNAQYG